jgi:hypothetical protein
MLFQTNSLILGLHQLIEKNTLPNDDEHLESSPIYAPEIINFLSL